MSWVIRWIEELKLSSKGNECKPLLPGLRARQWETAGGRRFWRGASVAGRGLHSSTFRLNFSACCGIGVHLGVL